MAGTGEDVAAAERRRCLQDARRLVRDAYRGLAPDSPAEQALLDAEGSIDAAAAALAVGRDWDGR